MSMPDLETQRNLRSVERALKRRQRTLGESETIVMTKDDVTMLDRELFGRPVRFEIDVCVPIDHLKKDLSIIKAELTNCILLLEQKGNSTHDKRFGVHRKLSAIRAKLGLRKKELGNPGLSALLNAQDE